MKETDKDVFWIGDRYCGLFRIGSGGMGEVWAGKALGDRGFERIVAIKRLHPDRRQRESHHRAILDEAAILQHLSQSPNIVSIIDLRVENGQPALIMEYVDGPELRDVLHALNENKQRLPFPLAVYIATEISKGLSSAHRCRHPKTGEPLCIVHRDVSPSNILVSSAGAVMLTDFGIAKSVIQTTETRVGEIKGKYQYMSPEQARGMKIDFRTDYFALGLVLYECLFGRPAYEAETDAEFIEQARNGVIHYPDGIAKPLKHVFGRLLAVNPNDRYRDLEEFRRDIGKAALDSGGTASSDDLRKFLQTLELPQLAHAVELRMQLEKVHEAPRSHDEAVTGEYMSGRLTRGKRLKISVGVAVVVAIATVGYFITKRVHSLSSTRVAVVSTGSLHVESEPKGAMLTLFYNDRKIESPSPASFSDIPLNTPLKVIAQKSDYLEASEGFILTSEHSAIDHTFKLTKKPAVSVRFTANPPSSVSIPGRFANQDAPSPIMSLPVGRYSVIFNNPLASGPAGAVLDAQNGGSFICSANMEVDLGSKEPTGNPPKAFCKPTP